MAAVTAGASVLILAGALLWTSFRLYRSGRFDGAAVALSLLALVLQGFAAGDRQLHTWDERFHAVVAKNLAIHPLTPTLYDDPVLPFDPHSWLEGHVWLHKPPFALWLIAASLRLFGNHEAAVRVPSLLLSAMSVFLTYRLGSWLLDRRSGLVAAYLHAVNGFLLDLASGRTATDHVDAVFIVLVEVAVALAVVHALRGRRTAVLLALGLVLGLAILTKWLGALVALVPWLALGAGRAPYRRASLALVTVLVIAAAVAVPWQIHTRHAFPSEATFEADYTVRHVSEAVEGHSASAAYYVAGMPRTFGELVYVPVAWFAWRLARRRLDRRAAAIAAWAAVPYVVFSLVATKMPAYVMTAAPALFLIQAAFWWYLYDALPELRWRRWGAGFLALLLLLPLRYGIERVKPFEGFALEPAWARDLRSLPDRLGPGRSVLFGTAHPIDAMFYTPWPAYSILPDARQARDLAARGYRVVVLQDDRPPAVVSPETEQGQGGQR